MAKSDAARWRCAYKVTKYSSAQTIFAQRMTGLWSPEGAHFRTLGMEPQEVREEEGNVLVTVGLDRLTGQLLSDTQVWDNSHTGIAVGDSSTSASTSDDDLEASTNKRYNQNDGTFPTQNDGVITFEATYDTGEANFAWEEWGLIVPNTTSTFTEGSSKPTSYVLLNRKVTSLGTKSSGATWVFTATVTIS